MAGGLAMLQARRRRAHSDRRLYARSAICRAIGLPEALAKRLPGHQRVQVPVRKV